MKRLALVLLLLLLTTTSVVAQDDLELRFLDVGQGDAILVRNGDKTALIDTGRSGEIVIRLGALGTDARREQLRDLAEELREHDPSGDIEL